MAVISRVAWMVSGRLLAAVLQAGALVLVARSSGPTGFGALAAFLGLVVVFQSAFDLGIPTYLLRQAARHKNSTEIALCLRVFRKIGWLLLFALFGLALLFSASAELDWWSFLPLAVAGWLERQADVRLNIAVANGEVWKNTVNLVFRRSITLALLVYGEVLGWNALEAFSLASMIGSMVSYLMSYRLARLPHFVNKLEGPASRELLRRCRPFWANSMGTQMRNFDVSIVTIMASPLVAGYYGAIARSLNPLMLLSTSLATIVLPLVARSEGKNQKKLWLPIGGTLGVVFAVYGALFALTPNLIPLVFGEDFEATTNGFRVALFGLVFASISAVQTAFLQALGKEKIVGRISMATSAFMMLSVAIGAVLGGVTGAALGLTACYALQFISLLLAILRQNNSEPKMQHKTNSSSMHGSTA